MALQIAKNPGSAITPPIPIKSTFGVLKHLISLRIFFYQEISEFKVEKNFQLLFINKYSFDIFIKNFLNVFPSMIKKVFPSVYQYHDF
jgi:hypothetical protein